MRRRINLARYHDGSAKTNWGGRATSLALAGIINSHPNAELSAVVNGATLTMPFDKPNSPVKRGTRLLSRVYWAVRRRLSGNPILGSPVKFGRESEIAAGILNHPRTATHRKLIKEIELCDELWMNGEGDFILDRRRATLSRTLIVMEIAYALGKPVYLVNSILSRDPFEPEPSPKLLASLEHTLSRCHRIVYRDPESHLLHREFFGNVEADWAPDALFAWAKFAPSMAKFSEQLEFGPFTETIDVRTQKFLNSGAPFVAVAGSSVRAAVGSTQKTHVAKFVEGLQRAGYATLFLGTDARDGWLVDLARTGRGHFVEARAPLAIGMSVLKQATAFVSGRYHPTILAATLGTPSVLMASNSHKTRSLQLLLSDEEPQEFSFFTASDSGALLDAVVAKASGAAEARNRLRSRTEAHGRSVTELIHTF